jgi:hypothetical protein
MMDEIMIKLINLETGELISKDIFDLKDKWFPKGFVVAEELSVEQWADALQKAINKPMYGRVNYSIRKVNMKKEEEK